MMLFHIMTVLRIWEHSINAKLGHCNYIELLFSNPWFTNGQHSGFVQLFGGIVFTTFKGASHQVPQSKRA